MVGRYAIPDVSVWAFEAAPGETSPIIEATPAYFVFRVDSVAPAGVPPLAAVRHQVLAAVQVEKRKVLARRRADSLAEALRGTPNLLRAGAAPGLMVDRFGPFTRLTPPAYLAREPVPLGAAFGLRVAERSGVIEGELGYYILESLARKLADSSRWLAQRDGQRIQVIRALQQARIDQYIDGLRAQAEIVDRRKDVFRAQATAEPLIGF